ncbi:MAG: TonB-dependent receptor [Aureispira sp.]|nr:TonB-dependent receptor [Aureispira sp.]
MLKFTFYLCTLLLLFPLVTQAQFTDTLYITDEDGFPVIEAIVYELKANGTIDSSSITKTDFDGVAILKDIDYHSTILVSDVRYHEHKSSIHAVRDNGGRVVLQTTLLGEITVYGTSIEEENLKEVPSKVSIIDKNDIKMFNPQTTGDAINNSGDIFLQKSQMGGGSPIIRGFEANKVLIVVDGVRLNNAIYRNGHLQNVITIDNAVLDRVEIHHGPASVMYGSDALGGVMHFFTKKPLFRPEGAKKIVDVNTYGRFSTANFEGTGHVDFNIGNSKVASLTSLTFSAFQDLRAGRLKSDTAMARYWNRYFYAERGDSTDLVRINENPNVQLGTAYSQLDVLQKLRYKPSEKLELGLNIQYSTTSNVPRYDQLTEGEVILNNNQITSQKLKFSEWSYGPQQRLLGALSASFTDDSLAFFNHMNIVLGAQKIDEDRITRRFGDPLRRIQKEDVYVFSLNMDFIKKFKNNSKLLYGLEVTHNIVNSSVETINIETQESSSRGIGTRYPDGGSTMSTAGVYTSYRLKLGNRANIITGIRYSFTNWQASFIDTSLYNLPYSQISSNNHALTGSLALAWDMGRGFQLNSIVSNAFRPPNIDDAGKIRAKGDNVTVPNPDLKSEKAINMELSLGKQFGKSVKLSGTFFYTHLFDALVQQDFELNGTDSLYYDGAFKSIRSNINAGKGYILGFSTNIQVEFGKFTYIKAGINYTEGRIIKDRNMEPLAHIPPLYGQLSFGYKRKIFQTRMMLRFNGAKLLKNYSEDSSENLDKALPIGTPAWFTINIYTSFQLGKTLSLHLGLENLLDWHYRPYASGVSAPGQNVIVTLRGAF